MAVTPDANTVYDAYGWIPNRMDLERATTWALVNDREAYQQHQQDQLGYDSLERQRSADLELIQTWRTATDPELRDHALLAALTADNQRRHVARIMTRQDLTTRRQRLTARLTPSGRQALDRHRAATTPTAEARSADATLLKIVLRCDDPQWRDNAPTADLVQDWRTLTAARTTWHLQVGETYGLDVPPNVAHATAELN